MTTVPQESGLASVPIEGAIARVGQAFSLPVFFNSVAYSQPAGETTCPIKAGIQSADALSVNLVTVERKRSSRRRRYSQCPYTGQFGDKDTAGASGQLGRRADAMP